MVNNWVASIQKSKSYKYTWRWRSVAWWWRWLISATRRRCITVARRRRGLIGRWWRGRRLVRRIILWVVDTARCVGRVRAGWGFLRGELWRSSRIIIGTRACIIKIIIFKVTIMGRCVANRWVPSAWTAGRTRTILSVARRHAAIMRRAWTIIHRSLTAVHGCTAAAWRGRAIHRRAGGRVRRRFAVAWHSTAALSSAGWHDTGTVDGDGLTLGVQLYTSCIFCSILKKKGLVLEIQEYPNKRVTGLSVCGCSEGSHEQLNLWFFTMTLL